MRLHVHYSVKWESIRFGISIHNPLYRDFEKLRSAEMTEVDINVYIVSDRSDLDFTINKTKMFGMQTEMVSISHRLRSFGLPFSRQFVRYVVRASNRRELQRSC